MSFFLSDFAVGAPYDNAGVGNVYIYHGSETGLSSTKAAQVFQWIDFFRILICAIQVAVPKLYRFFYA